MAMYLNDQGFCSIKKIEKFDKILHEKQDKKDCIPLKLYLK